MRRIRNPPVGELDAKIGANIRACRVWADRTMSDLSAEIGISESSLGRIETGRLAVRLRYLPMLAKALGVKVNDLLPVEWR